MLNYFINVFISSFFRFSLFLCGLCGLCGGWTDVFAVVQKEPGKGPKTYYRLHIANKPGVPPYTPFLPYPPVFEKGNEFRHFLFTKRKFKREQKNKRRIKEWENQREY
jgi:hypothetical protein